MIAEIVPLVEEFVARYTARRRADGVADFDDLLVWARDLLRNPQVRVYFHERYRCVLIDEFQDTDPVQAEIAMLLTDVDGDGVPEPGRLVVVGDPKQSIYRFRRADIAIYDEVKFGPLAAGPDADPAELPRGRRPARLGQPRLRRRVRRRRTRDAAAACPAARRPRGARGDARAGGRRPR